MSRPFVNNRKCFVEIHIWDFSDVLFQMKEQTISPWYFLFSPARCYSDTKAARVEHYISIYKRRFICSTSKAESEQVLSPLQIYLHNSIQQTVRYKFHVLYYIHALCKYTTEAAKYEHLRCCLSFWCFSKRLNRVFAIFRIIFENIENCYEIYLIFRRKESKKKAWIDHWLKT